MDILGQSLSSNGERSKLRASQSFPRITPSSAKGDQIAKNRNTFAKRQREQDKRQRSEDKRLKRERKTTMPDSGRFPETDQQEDSGTESQSES